MEKPSFTNLEVYQLADQVSDKVWDLVELWSYFQKDTLGKQLVRSADSVVANIAEGYGRFTYVENKRFSHIARGSLYETYLWIEKARKRKLIKEEEYVTLNK